MSQASDTRPLDSASTGTGKPDLLLSLPDVPTHAILSLLPLQQLIVNLPLVHPRLVPILEEFVLKDAKRLVLHIGDQKEIKQLQLNSSLRLPFAGHLVDSSGALLYPQTDTPFNTLHLETLNSQTVKQLISLMPDIVHLQVVISHAPSSVLPQLTSLLGHWAPTLQTLQLIIESFTIRVIPSLEERKVATSHLRSLLEEINFKLWALQTLYLDIGKGLNLNYDELFSGEPLSLFILGELREFYLHLGNYPSAPNFLLEQLKEYATGKLAAIGLGGDFNWDLNEIAKGRFAARFTHVPFNHFPTANDTLLLPSFTNLTVYGFDWQQLNALERIDHLRVLSTLPQLQCLKVHSFAPVLHPLPAPFPDLPPLRWLTVLEMSIFLHDHKHLQSPNWWTLFPSVQIVKVTHCGRFCAICYPDEDWDAREKITDYAQVTPCLRQLFAPLRDLPSLRKIFYQRKEHSDFIAEFTPQGEFVRTHEYIG